MRMKASSAPLRPSDTTTVLPFFHRSVVDRPGPLPRSPFGGAGAATFLLLGALEADDSRLPLPCRIALRETACLRATVPAVRALDRTKGSVRGGSSANWDQLLVQFVLQSFPRGEARLCLRSHPSWLLPCSVQLSSLTPRASVLPQALPLGDQPQSLSLLPSVRKPGEHHSRETSSGDRPPA